MCADFHQSNVVLSDQHHRALTGAVAHMEVAFVTIQAILGVCQHRQEVDPETASWCLVMEEEAKSCWSQLKSSNFWFYQEALVWPSGPEFPVLVATLNATSRGAQEFFNRARGEEASKVHHCAGGHSNEQSEHVDDDFDLFDGN